MRVDYRSLGFHTKHKNIFLGIKKKYFSPRAESGELESKSEDVLYRISSANHFLYINIRRSVKF